MNGEELETEPQEAEPKVEELSQDLTPDDSTDETKNAEEADILEDESSDTTTKVTQNDETFESLEDDESSSLEGSHNEDQSDSEDNESQSYFDDASELPVTDTDHSDLGDNTQEGALTPEDQSNELEDVADSMLESADDEEKLKHPLIIGSVEGREGYLMYKRKPTTEGMVWIKWDDGFEEEIIAESFRINRITEE